MCYGSLDTHLEGERELSVWAWSSWRGSWKAGSVCAWECQPVCADLCLSGMLFLVIRTDNKPPVSGSNISTSSLQSYLKKQGGICFWLQRSDSRPASAICTPLQLPSLLLFSTLFIANIFPNAPHEILSCHISQVSGHWHYTKAAYLWQPFSHAV